MKSIILTIFFTTLGYLAHSQGPQWTLERCIEYANKHSISNQQQALSVEDRELALNTAKNSRLPSLSASVGANSYFGRGPSRDGTYKDEASVSGNLGLSTNIPIYQGGRIKHQVAESKLNLEAAMYDLNTSRENITLNVTALYLQVLFKMEIIDVAESNLELSRKYLVRSRGMFDGGKSPESAIYESEALVAKDELSLTLANNDLQLAVIELSQAMNFPRHYDFDMEVPKMDSVAMVSLMDPDEIYNCAMESRPNIKAEEIRLESRIRAVRGAKASLFPTISFSAGYGTNVYHSYATGAFNDNLWNQIRNNGNEHLGISINVPIFNRRATRNSIKSAQLSVQSQELVVLEQSQQLRKDVERAYFSANAAYSRYISAEKAYESAQVAFDYEEQRSQAGRSTIFDFDDARTRMEGANSEVVQSKYDYIFRTKMLVFYVDGTIDL